MSDTPRPTPPPGSNAEIAAAYICNGWSVFPLRPRSKQPAVKWTDYQYRRMTQEEAVAHWTANPEHGIAIVTGAISNLVVIDVDPRNGGDDVAVCQATPYLDATYIVETGGGGRHFYCRHPGGTVPCGKTSMPGVDRKGDGGYVVAPPSIHPDTGRPYVVLFAHQPVELPRWVTEKPAPSTTAVEEPAEPWIADTLANPQGCEPGTQEETLSRLAWWAAKRLPPDIALGILCAWARQLPLSRPSDPWTVAHVEEKLNRAYEKRALEPGAAGGLVDDVATAKAAAFFEEVADLQFPDQAWVVEDFAAPGACTEIIGKVKKGKSTLTYQLVNAVRTGEPFLGRPTQKGGAVILTEQTGTSLKKTLERAGLLGVKGIYVMRKPSIAAAGGWDAAVAGATELCIQKGIKLIVVDTLSRLSGLGGDAENKAGAVSVLDPFTRARDLGVACIFVRHARKGQSGEMDDIADTARGSSAITGDMDIVIRLAPVSSGDLRCLSWESRITDDPEDIYLEYQNGIYVVAEKPETKGEENERERLDEMRAAMAEVGNGTTDLQAKLGWSRKTVIKYRRQVETYTHGPAAGKLTSDSEEE